MNPANTMPSRLKTPTMHTSGVSRHIVHGVLSLDLGGLERLVLDLVKIGVQRGHRVSVVCVERPGKLAGQAEDMGANVVCLNKPRGRSRQAVADAELLLRELQPDVLHTHQIGALWYLGQAAARMGLAGVVHTEHSDHVRLATGWLGKLRARYLWWRGGRLAARICCVSDDVATAMRRLGTVPSGRVKVVPNGIDTDVYGDRSRRNELRKRLGLCREGDAAGAVVVGTVGRLTEVKRQDLLLRAVASLSESFPRLRLLLVGDGPERARLEEFAATLGIAERTVFAGYQARPEEYLAAMDLFALTSRHEALPLALLEAWASGVPVVASAVGGIPKVVEQGRTALLFPSGDCEALVETLRIVLSDTELASKLALSGAAEVQAKYSLQRMADNYEQQYQAAAKAMANG